MDSVLRERGLTGNRAALECVKSNHNSGQGPVSMDTNTNVTNSPMASGNPTPAPCGQTSTSLVKPTAQVIQSAAVGQLIVARTRPTHPTLISSSNIPAFVQGYPQQQYRAYLTQADSALLTNSSCDAQSLGPRLRPVLVSAAQVNPSSQLQQHQQQPKQTYQIIACPPGQNPATLHQLLGSKTANTPNIGYPTAVVGAGVPNAAAAASSGIAAVDPSNAARIAQLLSPTAQSTQGNTQLLIYYPQPATAAGKFVDGIPLF